MIRRKEIDSLIEAICNSMYVDKDAVLQTERKTRAAEIIKTRALIMICLRGELTLKEIGSIFKLNHATVIHAIKKHDEYLKDFTYRISYGKFAKFFKEISIQKLIEFHEKEIIKLNKML